MRAGCIICREEVGIGRGAEGVNVFIEIIFYKFKMRLEVFVIGLEVFYFLKRY